MKISKQDLQEMIHKALVGESYVPNEILDWTAEASKRVKDTAELLEHLLDNVEDYPSLKKDMDIRQSLSTIRRCLESVPEIRKAISKIYDAFIRESRR